MSRVTSLTSMPEKELNRWIKRVALLFVVLLVAFVAFYAVDRFRAPQAPLADQRLTALEEAVRTNPADVVSRGQLADLYYAKRRFQDAIVQYSALIDAGKSVELATLGRGDCYRQLKTWDSATADYNAVVAIANNGEMANVDPNLEAAYFGLGAVALAQGKPADAIDPLTKAIAITRTDADALNALGAAYVQTGKAQEAIDPLRRAIQLVPVGWSEPYSNLAQAYKSLNKPDYAAWANAMATLETGDTTGAEQQLKALVNGDAAVLALVGLGVAAETRGDHLTASDWYRQALVKDPTNIEAQMGLKRTTSAAPTAAAPSTSPAPSASK